MNAKNITLVIASMRSGGAERVMSNLANALASANHKVTLILFTKPSEQPFYSLNPAIRVIALDCLSADPSPIIYAKNILFCLYILRKTLKHISPDVVISFLESVNIATLLASIGLKFPVIISERNDPAFHTISKLYAIARIKIYPRCARLIVQTQSVYNFFPKHFKCFLHIIPNPITPPTHIKQTHALSLEKFVTVGRLSTQKDHLTLLLAFAGYTKTNPNATLTLYGEGEQRSALQTKISELSLDQKVFLPGNVAYIQEKLHTYDAFVFPSLYEGFPNALCEAMSIGLPVIASHVTGNKDVVQNFDNGLLFPCQNVDELYQCMMTLSDQSYRINLGQKAQLISQTYCDKMIYKQWEEVIEDVCVA